MMYGKLYIDGAFCEGKAKQTYAVYNPYDLSTAGQQAIASGDDVDRAIESAQYGFSALKQLTAFQRADALRKLYDLMTQHEARLANIMTLEQGKPLKEALGEVRYAASYVRWYAEEGVRIKGDILAPSHPKSRLHVHYEPIGPVALITPWNFPLAMFVRKMAPALAAGCSVIVKPASQTPLTAVTCFELIDQLALPKGACQLLTGDAALIGSKLIDDFRIRKLSFTGSTEVGQLLAAKSANTLKRVSLELGGQAPFIVMDDADIARAVKGLIQSKFRNCGQACIASNRLFVQRGIYQDFKDALIQKVSQLTVGNGFDDVDLGPVIDEANYNNIDRHVSEALASGASCLVGGRGYRQSGNSGGYLYPATVLGNVNDDMLIANEETFGPVIPMLQFETLDEVTQRANNTPFGLAAYAYSESLNRTIQLAEGLEYGMIGINSAVLGTAQAPFGGVKLSGYGREGGQYGIMEYVHTKYVNIGV